MKNLIGFVAACAYAALSFTGLKAEDVIADEESELARKSEGRKWVSLNAFADVETAYICRGYIWDVRPYAAQYADTSVDLGPFGIVEASIWTYSALSPSGHSARMSRYAYAEADYLLRYYYDIDIADGWRLRNGLGRQWVTNPGYVGGRTLCDFQALQVLQNPYVVPYWRLRVIRRPIDETYWVAGLKRSFEILDDLTFTVDFFGDLGDRRHYDNLYGDWADAAGRRLRGGLKTLNLVLRLDYRLIDHLSLFAFVGQFCIVADTARNAVKAEPVTEARRDITYGGAGIALDF